MLKCKTKIWFRRSKRKAGLKRWLEEEQRDRKARTNKHNHPVSSWGPKRGEVKLRKGKTSETDHSSDFPFSLWISERTPSWKRFRFSVQICFTKEGLEILLSQLVPGVVLSLISLCDRQKHVALVDLTMEHERIAIGRLGSKDSGQVCGQRKSTSSHRRINCAWETTGKAELRPGHCSPGTGHQHYKPTKPVQWEWHTGGARTHWPQALSRTPNVPLCPGANQTLDAPWKEAVFAFGEFKEILWDGYKISVLFK